MSHTLPAIPPIEPADAPVLADAPATLLGHFKPNVSVMVGQLYARDDPRRDGAPPTQERGRWVYAFGVGGIVAAALVAGAFYPDVFGRIGGAVHRLDASTFGHLLLTVVRYGLLAVVVASVLVLARVPLLNRILAEKA